MNEDEDEELDPEVEKRLEEAKQQMEKVAKSQDFAAKRKMHYKMEEGDVLRKVREKKMVHKGGIASESSNSSSSASDGN